MPTDERIAIYPGSFDPVTNGHVDVIRRATRLFDRLIVAIGVNTAKQTLFSTEERMALVRSATTGVPGLEVDSFDGMLVDYARRRGAVVIVRGVRQGGDLEYEMRMFFANRRMAPDVDTVFLAPSEEHALVSASIVREIHGWGGDVRSFVPDSVAEALAHRNSM